MVTRGKINGGAVDVVKIKCFTAVVTNVQQTDKYAIYVM